MTRQTLSEIAPYNVYIYPEAYLDYSSFLQVDLHRHHRHHHLQRERANGGISEQIGPVDGTSAQYLVNLPEGDRLRVNVRDSSTSIEDSAFVGPKQIGKSGTVDSVLEQGQVSHTRRWEFRLLSR